MVKLQNSREYDTSTLKWSTTDCKQSNIVRIVFSVPHTSFHPLMISNQDWTIMNYNISDDGTTLESFLGKSHIHIIKKFGMYNFNSFKHQWNFRLQDFILFAR